MNPSLESEQLPPSRIATKYARECDPLAPDPEDIYRPRPMSEPRMLFRSMALPELVEIMRTGKVVGGGNIFHDGEHRPYVFFGDELNEGLLGNGESLDRCAAVVLRDHETHAQLADARIQLRLRAKAMLHQLRRDGIKPDRHDLWAFRSGGDKWPFIRSLSRCTPIHRAKYAALLRRYAEASRVQRRLQARHSALLRSTFSTLSRRAANQPYTSAVIVTYLVTGGLEYRNEFGVTLNGGQPEYGFLPGQITTDEIMEVLLVKRGAIVRRIRPESFDEVVPLCEAAMAVEPAEEASSTWGGWWGGRLTVTCSASGEFRWSAEGELGLFPLRIPWIFDGRQHAPAQITQ